MTIFINPSAEQILTIAKEHPDLNEKIKSEVMEQLQAEGMSYVKNKLKGSVTSAYAELCLKFEKEYFTTSSWGTPQKFNAVVEKSLTAKIEEHFNTALEKEMEEYIQSEAFKTTLQTRIQRQLLTVVLASLDAQIKTEATKLIS